MIDFHICGEYILCVRMYTNTHILTHTVSHVGQPISNQDEWEARRAFTEECQCHCKHDNVLVGNSSLLFTTMGRQ